MIEARRFPVLTVCTALVLAWIAPVFAQNDAVLPPIKTVTRDARGAFRVNDKPFFPIALYDAPLDDDTLRTLHEFGFNVLACDAKSSSALRLKGFYAASHADVIVDDLSGVFLGIGMDSPALNFKTDLLKQTAEYNAKTAAAVPGRPVMNAIGYWVDEPEGVFQGRLPSKAVYEDLVAAIDVSAPYLYPVPHQPVSSVAEAVARARAATSGRKPLLPVLQLFAWKADDRYPTPAELRCMAFLALVEGAHGIGYYSYGVVTGRPGTNIAAAQPALWNSVKDLNRDLADIGPRLLAGKETQALMLTDAGPAVKSRIVHETDGVLAVVVNTASERRTAKFAGAAANLNAIERRGGGKLDTTQGAATLTLEPFGVEILRVKPASPR